MSALVLMLSDASALEIACKCRAADAPGAGSASSRAMKDPRGFLGFLLSPKAGAGLLILVLAAFLFYYFLGGAHCWGPAAV